ncbi:MAG: caspase family protein [Alphaproteobacteria bacterium]
MRLCAALTVLMICAGSVLIGAARAEDRLALVIGNSSYAVGPLANPVNDAALIARSLGDAGFDVAQAADLGYRDLQRAVVDFARRLAEAGPDAVGMVYYAGHAVQANGQNYLIPIDADIQDELDLEIQTLRIDTVMQSLGKAGNRLNMVVLDACRNNPFGAIHRSGVRGLAKTDAPFDTLVAYSTAPGDVAADGAGRNSPYTAALARIMRIPGLPVEQVFKQVRVAVMERTGNRQVPWESSSLTEEFYFYPPASPATVESPGGSAAQNAEIAFWNSVSDSGDKAQLEDYLTAFPDGVFAALARSKIAALGTPGKVISGWTFSPYDGKWRLNWRVMYGFGQSGWCRDGEEGSLDFDLESGRYEGRIRSNRDGVAEVKITFANDGNVEIETYSQNWRTFPRRRTLFFAGDGWGVGGLGPPSGRSCVAELILERLSD